MSEDKRRIIGFLRDFRPSPTPVLPAADDWLYKFDSGRVLTPNQASRSIAVIGATGSGKTRAVVLPLLYHLMVRGYAGLVIDVKGNLGEQTREIAKAAGREQDIVEFGTGERAVTTNLFSGMNDAEINNFFLDVVINGNESDGNNSWHCKGAKMAYEVASVCRHLSKIARRSDFSRELRPSLRLIYGILTSRDLAKGIWCLFAEELKRLQKQYEARFYPEWLTSAVSLSNTIQSDLFSVLVFPDKRRNMGYEEQVTWNLQQLLRHLQEFKTAGLFEKFSDNYGVPLNFKDLVCRQKKIVVLRFGAMTGRAGDLLAACIKKCFNQTILDNGLSLADGDYTFTIGDEFQHLIDVTRDNPQNDCQMSAVTREYHHINVIATQSVAALYAQAGERAVDALLANYKTRIYLQNSDDATIQWAGKTHDGAALLPELKQGEVILETVQDGTPVFDRDSVNNAYASMMPCLGNADDNLRRQCRRELRRADVPRGPTGLPLIMELCFSDGMKRVDDDTCKKMQKRLQYGSISVDDCQQKRTKAMINALCVMREKSKHRDYFSSEMKKPDIDMLVAQYYKIQKRKETLLRERIHALRVAALRRREARAKRINDDD